ncbi:PREDICTED: zinc finger HIT domain-containing protein 3 [Ceratosolen solmsi marchali]|uniref:Zinc finger HIT domain-containing protein 3 n=1 Tax=Ceratosolen solmsi marchali TaxID=326594 RepID=A0AAJ6YXV2_9HYME|nr:PREDICTED: zinc finger HIT domain-containing protein 3 [Ceratosolen solmsi marchali]
MSIKICCICEFENAKYKCPKCKKFYCSVACCSKHKENCTGSIESNNCDIENSDSTEKTNVPYSFPTEDTVPIEKLEQLRYSKDLKNYLKTSQVRDIITEVLKDNNPTKAIANAMTEPLFVELADACLKVVEPSEEERPC